MSFTAFLTDDPLHTRAWYMQLFIQVANSLGWTGDKEKAACVLAGMCTFQEAGVRNNDEPFERRIWCPANPTNEPESTHYDHDSESDDGRSCGICQQQRGPGGELWWGTVADEMNPQTAIATFMKRLPAGFHSNDAVAANGFVQAVQRSGVPLAYTQWWGDAIALYNEVKGGVTPTVPVDPATTPYEHGPWTGDPSWLADIMRAEGLTVIERSMDYGGDVGVVTWRDRGHGDMGSLWGIVCHHTGSNNSPWTEIWNGRPDLAGPLANIFLRRDGVVEIIAAGACWHAGTGYAPGCGHDNANQRCIGIEAQNDGGGVDGKPHRSSWPDVQYDAYVKVCAAFMRRIDGDSSHVLSHHEWDIGDPATYEGKWDPGAIDMNIFRSDVQARIDAFKPEEDDMAAGLEELVGSTSPFRELGEKPYLMLKDMIRYIDGATHFHRVILAAALGDASERARLERISKGDPAQYPDRAGDIVLAGQALEFIDKTPTAEVIAAIANGGTKIGDINVISPDQIPALPTPVSAAPTPVSAVCALGDGTKCVVGGGDKCSLADDGVCVAKSKE